MAAVDPVSAPDEAEGKQELLLLDEDEDDDEDDDSSKEHRRTKTAKQQSRLKPVYSRKIMLGDSTWRWHEPSTLAAKFTKVDRSTVSRKCNGRAEHERSCGYEFGFATKLETEAELAQQQQPQSSATLLAQVRLTGTLSGARNGAAYRAPAHTSPVLGSCSTKPDMVPSEFPWL